MAYTAILKRAFALVPAHGFSRQALAAASASSGQSSSQHAPVPEQLSSSAESSTQPLSETAINALFGAGDEASKTLIKAWMEEGRVHMSGSSSQTSSEAEVVPQSIEDVLLRRLKYNEPVLRHLKDAFALVSTSPNPFVPILDVRPSLEHAWAIADEACYLCPSAEQSSNWYTRRLQIAGVYTAAELHQLSSPSTTASFLKKTLRASESPARAVNEMGLYGDFARRGWAGILHGRGL